MRFSIGPRQLLRWVASGVAVLIFVPVAGEFFIELAREHRLYDKPSEKVEALSQMIGVITSHSAFPWVAMLLLGIVIGLWADTALRQFERRNDSRWIVLRQLGDNCRSMNSLIRKAIEPRRISASDFAERIGEIEPKYASFHATMRKQSIKLPMPAFSEPRPYFDALGDGLSAIGVLLDDGHEREARTRAKALTRRLSAMRG